MGIGALIFLIYQRLPIYPCPHAFSRLIVKQPWKLSILPGAHLLLTGRRLDAGRSWGKLHDMSKRHREVPMDAMKQIIVAVAAALEQEPSVETGKSVKGSRTL